MTDYHSPPTLAEYDASIDRWLRGFAKDNPVFEAIDRGAVPGWTAAPATVAP